MDRDAKKMRGDGPTVFAQVNAVASQLSTLKTSNLKDMIGIPEITEPILKVLNLNPKQNTKLKSG
jgi:hypothetical protein